MGGVINETLGNKKVVTVALALGLGASACGGEKTPPVQTNEAGKVTGALLLAKKDAVILEKPNQLDSKVGTIERGQDVIARCYYESPPNSGFDDLVFVDAAGTISPGDGYVYVLSRQGSKDESPENIFDYSVV